MEGHVDHPGGDTLGQQGLGLDDAAAGRHLDQFAVFDAQPAGIVGVHLDVAAGVQFRQAVALAGHRGGVEVVQDAAGGEDEGIVVVGQFDRFLERRGVEAAEAAAEAPLVEIGRAGMLGVGTRPLEPTVLEPLVGDAAVDGSEAGHLVHYLGWVVVVHGVAHAGGEVGDDLPVGPGLARWLDGLADSLDAALGVGEGAVLLGETGPRQDEVGQGGRLGQEDVLDQEEVEALQGPADVADVRVGDHGVLAHDVEGPDLSAFGRLEDLQIHCIYQIDQFGQIPGPAHCSQDCTLHVREFSIKEIPRHPDFNPGIQRGQTIENLIQLKFFLNGITDQGCQIEVDHTLLRCILQGQLECTTPQTRYTVESLPTPHHGSPMGIDNFTILEPKTRLRTQRQLNMSGDLKLEKNTQKITKAMKMVAAAKLRRAQTAVTEARPYADTLARVLARVSERTEYVHPLLERREGTRAWILVVSSDKGLCGSFNANLLREVEKTLNQTGRWESVEVLAIGRKAAEFFARRDWAVVHEERDTMAHLGPDDGPRIAQMCITAFKSGQVDEVHVVYNRFINLIRHELTMERVLPIEPPAIEDHPADDAEVDYLYEPSPAELLETLLPSFVEVSVQAALLDSAAAEQAARMTSMEAATKNADEMIASLTLLFNRTRQAAITKELIEIVSGAQALAE